MSFFDTPIQGGDWQWTSREVTKEQLNAAFREAYNRSQEPMTIMVGVEQHAMMRIGVRALDEGWNWRRTKREMRKGTRSTYRR